MKDYAKRAMYVLFCFTNHLQHLFIIAYTQNKFESIVVQGTADTRESLLNMVDKYGIGKQLQFNHRISLLLSY